MKVLSLVFWSVTLLGSPEWLSFDGTSLATAVSMPESQATTMTTTTSNKIAQSAQSALTSLSATSQDSTAAAQHDPMVPASILVGLVTSAIGIMYGKVLGLSVNFIWKTLPTYFDRINPVYFITSICTLGGLLMGILTSASPRFGSAFTVADFVSAFSIAPAQTLPSSRVHLLPLLLLSLITSACGFSVGTYRTSSCFSLLHRSPLTCLFPKGPEAPMVCAGALVGASMARVVYPQDIGDDEVSRRHQTTLAYTGAAGALTAFMGIPVAGSVFALEMT